MDDKEREIKRLQKEYAHREKIHREQMQKNQLHREQIQKAHKQQLNAQQLEKERQEKERLQREKAEKEKKEKEKQYQETLRKEKERKKRRCKLFIKTLLITFAVMGALLLAAYGIFTYLMSGIERNEVDETHLSVNEELPKVSGVTNIAFFGLDSRQHAYEGRSDAIMIASVNHDTGKIKLVSIARDTYVEIPGYGGSKINHAYAYGGAELAIQTINENFGMDITDYVSVNFDSLAVVIDAMGGIDLEVSEAERQQINAYLLSGEPLRETGLVHLTGPQAVSYARIRKIDGDDMRTQRQRNVLSCLFQKAKEVSVIQYPIYAKKFASLVETSLTNQDILRLASVGMHAGLTLEVGSFPNEALPGEGKYIGPAWHYVYDLDQASDMLHKFIYDDIPLVEANEEEEDSTESVSDEVEEDEI